MEAPDRIYIHPTLDNLYGMRERSCDSEIEYVRKDAFIEKVCDTYCRLCDTKECGDNGECIWVEKFRKHLMK